MKYMNQEIKKLQRLSIFFTAIGVIVSAFFIAFVLLFIVDAIQESRNASTKQQAVIDSLEMEIQLRDNLINHTKDTIYGEEKTN